ncbi:MAG: tetratricopeptide repeat protein [Verrucomicrobiota bacterium]
MPTLQERCDDAIMDFTLGETDSAIGKLKSILAEDPDYFDALLALGQAYFAKGDFQAAIVEGHKAQKMKPNEQLVHTNLSRAYMKIGDKTTAEHHGLQARIASWKENMAPPTPGTSEPELEMAKPAPPPMKIPDKFPDMPWKKKSTDSGAKH